MAQQGQASLAAVAAGVPGFFMTFNLPPLNELPDEKADRAGGRLNLVLLLGRRGAARIYLAAAALGCLSIAVSVVFGLLPWPCLFAILPVVALAPAARWSRTPDEAVPLRAMAGNVAWNLFTNLLLAIGFIAARAL
jgi:1,4-dihydroxy-2-naphthoate octaprenyltransferase